MTQSHIPPSTPDAGPDDAAALALEEFRALRATIRERGSVRVALAVIGLAVWALLQVLVQVWLATPVAMLLPLLVLAGVFEGVFAIHVGVERVGRYLEVAYETRSGGPRWEHTAHAFGRMATDTAGRTDPLFAGLFAAAALLNAVPVVLLTLGAAGPAAGPLSELALYGGLHLLLIWRIGRARRFSGRQRAQELDLFGQLHRPD